MLLPYIHSVDNNSFILDIYVQPNATKSAIVGLYNNALKIKLKALPVDGMANKEILMFFSKLLVLNKNKIKLINGEKSRYKKILISDVGLDYLNRLKDVLK